jgi:hypothetical protein
VGQTVKVTQNVKILEHLAKFGSITTLEAFNNYGITRLASRVHELREAGIKITVDNVIVKNRYEENVHVARYSLGKIV